MNDQGATTAVSPLFARYEPRPPRAPGHACEVGITQATADDVREIAPLFAARQGIAIGLAIQRVENWFAKPLEGETTFLARRESRMVGYGRIGFVHAIPEYAHVPEGWYLTGVVIEPAMRRRGIATALTQHRLRTIAARGAGEAYYFANSINRASIDLHGRLGFEEIARDFQFPGATFGGGGIGILFRINLKEARS